MSTSADDGFARVVAREAELRAQLEGGRLSPDQAAAIGELRPKALNLTVEAMRRIVDEGVDPDLLRHVLELRLPLTLDDILELMIDYEPDYEFFADLAKLGEIDRGDADRLLDAGVHPGSVARLRDAGMELTVRDAARLADEAVDLDDLADLWAARPLPGLSIGRLTALIGEGGDLRSVARLLDADLGLSADAAAELVAAGADPDIIVRLIRDQSLSPEEVKDVVTSRGINIVLGLNGRLAGRQHLFGLGRTTLNRDGTADGVWVGTLRVGPGVHATIDTFVVGSVEIGLGADVTVAGTVTGEVRVRGGIANVTGTVRGSIVTEDDDAWVGP